MWHLIKKSNKMVGENLLIEKRLKKVEKSVEQIDIEMSKLKNMVADSGENVPGSHGNISSGGIQIDPLSPSAGQDPLKPSTGSDKPIHGDAGQSIPSGDIPGIDDGSDLPPIPGGGTLPPPLDEKGDMMPPPM